MMKPGDHFHSLELLEQCGRGAYGEVWLCKDMTGKILAVKITPKNKREAELKGISELRKNMQGHPGILQIHHVDKDENGLWYTMDAADNLTPEGKYTPDTLENRIKQDKTIELIPVMRRILESLEVLHNANIVHRDVKPANILFIKGEAVLADLGTVTGNTASMSLAGTHGFIPPEVQKGSCSPGTVGKAGDVYAAGKVLYCMLTGNPPESFPGLPTGIAITPQVQRLHRLVRRICEKKASARLTSIPEILAELDSIEHLSDTPESWGEYLHPRKKTIRKILFSFLFLLLLCAAAAGGYYFYRTHAEPNIPSPKPAPEIPSSAEPEKVQEPEQEKRIKYICTIDLSFSMQIPETWDLISWERLLSIHNNEKHKIPEKIKKKIPDSIWKFIDSGRNVINKTEPYVDKWLKSKYPVLEENMKLSLAETEKVLSVKTEHGKYDILFCAYEKDFSDRITIAAGDPGIRELLTLRTDFEIKKELDDFLPELTSFQRETRQDLTLVSIEFSGKPEELRQKMVLVVHEKFCSYITLTAKEERYSDLLPEFDNALKTLKFSDSGVRK